MGITKTTARIGNVLYLYLGTAADEPLAQQEIDKLISRLEPDGDGIKLDDGTAIHVEDQLCFDSSQSGSAAYVWDKSGNKCRHARIRVTIKGGKRTETFLRFVYKSIV